MQIYKQSPVYGRIQEKFCDFLFLWQAEITIVSVIRIDDDTLGNVKIGMANIGYVEVPDGVGKGYIPYGYLLSIVGRVSIPC